MWPPWTGSARALNRNRPAGPAQPGRAAAAARAARMPLLRLVAGPGLLPPTRRTAGAAAGPGLLQPEPRSRRTAPPAPAGPAPGTGTRVADQGRRCLTAWNVQA